MQTLVSSHGQLSELADLPHQLPANRGRYSLRKAIHQTVEHAIGRGGAKFRLDGLEAEVHQELALRSAKDIGFGAVLIPLDISAPRMIAERRSYNTTSGAGSVVTNLEPLLLIDSLRARSVCASLGARTPIVDYGKLAVPKRTATVTAGFVAEETAKTASTPTYSPVTYEPKSMSASVDTTRQFLASSPDAEAILWDDFSASMATELDRVALDGSGSGSEPYGIRNNASVAVLALGTNGLAPTRGHLVEMERLVGVANGDSAAGASMAYCTTPSGRAKLKLVEKATGTGRFLWDDDDRPNGKPGVATNQLPSNLTKGSGTGLSPLIFGNWNDILMPMWGAMTVQVNPYALTSSGYIKVTAFLEADVNVRHAESFIKVVDMITV